MSQAVSTFAAFNRRLFRSAVAWSFLGTFLRAGAGVFILPLILRTMRPEHLGLWYVFGTLGTLAALLDLGFEPTITRMASYLWAGAPGLVAFGIRGGGTPAESSQPNLEEFSRLVATLRAYYILAGFAILLMLIGGGGAWVWIKTAGFPDAPSLRWAWVVYSAGCWQGFISGRWAALLIGIDAQRQSQQIGAIGLLLYYFVAVSGLMLGTGLWALVSATVVTGLFGRSAAKRLFSRLVSFPHGVPGVGFHRDIFAAIWPNAWRMGLVALGGFMIVQANTIICSAYLGLTTTASYGLSFQLITMISGLSSVWVVVKMPAINRLRVRENSAEIARIFAGRMRVTILCYAVGALVIVFLAPRALTALSSKTALLPTTTLAVMALVQFLEMHHSLYAQLVLTENRNPFVRPAVISGVCIVVLSILLTPRIGVWGMLLSAGIVQACFNNWWPILRAIRGLHLTPKYFFSRFFLPLPPWKLL